MAFSTLLSTGTRMTVVFTSDDTETAPGFRATFEQVSPREEFFLVVDADNSKIYKQNRLGTNVEDLLVAGLQRPVAVDFDPVERKVYFTDVVAKFIGRINIDGSDQETIATNMVDVPDGLVVDSIGRILYWTDTGNDMITTSNLDGSGRNVFISTNLDEPRDIIVYQGGGYVYWTDWGSNPKIERCLFDGSGRVSIIMEDLGWPNGLALDEYESKLYWADALLNRIERSNFDGSQRQLLEDFDSNDVHPFSIVVLETAIFWTDWLTQGVDVTDRNFQNETTTLHVAGIPTRLHDIVYFSLESLIDYTTTPYFQPTTGTLQSESIFVSFASSYFFTSPNYPSDYPNNLRYTWYFSTNPGVQLILAFLEIDTEANFDFINVREGNEFFSGELLLQWSGTGPAHEVGVLSSGNVMSVTFETDGSVTRTGFSAFVLATRQTIDERDCGEAFNCQNGVCVPEERVCNNEQECGNNADESNENCADTTSSPTTDSEFIFVASSYYFTSPNYPSDYPNSLQYTWYFSTYPGLKLLLSFIDINTESFYDYITVNDGNGSFSGELLLRLSGEVSPNKVRIISSENDISVTFETDASVRRNGFAALAVVTCLDIDELNCEGEFNCKNGVCLSEDRVCNRQEECGNNADESSDYCPEDFVTEELTTDFPLTTLENTIQGLRLAGGNSSAGRVEVLYSGEWGTVCDDSWDINDALVVCLQLGFPDVIASYGNAFFGQGSGQIWMDDVQCNGLESSLSECMHNGFGIHNCGHHEDAGVACGVETSQRLRLAGGNSSAGRVEVLYNGEWGTVCDDSWDINDALVVCLQLGFPNAIASYGNAFFGQGSGQIWMDDVQCNGMESSLSECMHNGFGIHNCGHHEDAGVACGVRTLQGLRLAGGNSSAGRVEVLYNGQWGTVCDDSWDINDALVVCLQLGFPNAIASYGNAFFGQGSGQIWMDDVQCNGMESSLSECMHNGFGIHNCGHHEDAGVACGDNTPPSVPVCPVITPVVSFAGDIGNFVSWTIGECTDAEDGSIVPSCFPVSFSFFPVGSTPVICTCRDSGGLSRECTFNAVVVGENTAPSIPICPTVPSVTSLDGNIGNFVSWNIGSCLDAEDGFITPTCDPLSGSFFSVGSNAVVCTCTDSGSLFTECTFNVVVVGVDNTPPSVPVCPVITPVVSFAGDIGNFVSWTIGECTDAEDGSIVPSCDPVSFSFFGVGSTPVTCTCRDSGGLSRECTFNAVVVGANTAPSTPVCPVVPSVTSLSGNIGNIVSWNIGNCFDAEDGIITPICDPPSASFFSVGSSAVVCTCTDSGSLSTECTFNAVVVGGNTAPSVPICPDVSPITSFAGNIGNFVSWTIEDCTDAEDGSIVPSCFPVSFSLFPVGSTPVICTCTDSGGLSRECTFDAVVVGENTAPSIPICPTVPSVTSLNGNIGNFVSWNIGSCLDAEDGFITPTCDPLSGSLFSLGSNAVVCTCTDSGSLSTECTFNVVVVGENTAPSVPVCPDVSPITSFAGNIGNFVSWTIEDCTDAEDGIIFPSCDPVSFSFFSVGSTPVICTCRDSGGLSRECTFDAVVVGETPSTVSCLNGIPTPQFSTACICDPGFGGDVCDTTTTLSGPLNCPSNGAATFATPVTYPEPSGVPAGFELLFRTFQSGTNDLPLGENGLVLVYGNGFQIHICEVTITVT
ncbi:Deleted in malignant brain tumors 1 protein [Holothuria leucospilota]|uniref:Deleted in malignant brain tumors 1 protein n=1 Tax=Holothuria leucospilota TaxID=206669 RepID=A0A9Q1HAN1_HOLLE|nr:Deleted in malignant brain tumors 1 protein [Holothuria leucospilota]